MKGSPLDISLFINSIFLYFLTFLTYSEFIREVAPNLSLIRYAFPLISFFLFVVFYGKINKKVLFFVFCSVFLLFINENYFILDCLILVLFSFLLSKVSERWINALFMWVVILCLVILLFVFIFTLYYPEYNEQYIMSTNTGFSVKQGFGFVNPNVISMSVFTLIVISYHVRSKALTFVSFLFFVIGSYYWGSRTYILSLVLFFVLVLMRKYLSKIRFIYLAFILFIPFVSVFLYIDAFSSVFSVIDVISSGRITAEREILSEFSVVNLLIGGVDVEKVDIAYFNIINSIGVLGYFFVFFVFFIFLFRVGFFYSEYVVFLYLLSFVLLFENVLSINSLLALLFFIGLFKLGDLYKIDMRSFN